MNKDSYIVRKEDIIIILDSKSAVCISKNGKDTNHTRQFSRILYFLRDGKNRKMHKIGWCEGGLQLAYIATKNVGENDLNPRIKYIMVRLDN